MPISLTFKTSDLRRKHFRKHGAEFGATSPVHYERLASTFLISPLNSDSEECTRIREGDYIRLDTVADEIAFKSFDGFIKTYFKPDTVVHGFSTNRDYFLSECNQQ